ncbi:hypothetical protein CIW49_13660 [Mycolicibacterium sp. P1-18]|nr:hypothetical protein CIW49_13660 [Mycolicibacterium sp. P1-18]
MSRSRYVELGDPRSQLINGLDSASFWAARRPRCQHHETTNLVNEFVENGPRHPAVFIQLDRHREFDLAAVASGREVGRSHDDPSRSLPQQGGDFRVKEAARYTDGEEIPAKIALFGGATAVDQYRHLDFAEPILFFKNGRD